MLSRICGHVWRGRHALRKPGSPGFDTGSEVSRDKESNNDVAEQQASAIKHTQDELLDEHQKAFDGWCARCHKAADGLLMLTHASLQAKSPPDLIRPWMHWFQGAVERLSEDTTDQKKVGATVIRCCANAPLAMVSSSDDQQSHPARTSNGQDATRSSPSRSYTA